MTAFIAFLIIAALILGFSAIAISIACYMFVWTANGKHELKPVLIFGSIAIIGLILVWLGCINVPLVL